MEPTNDLDRLAQKHGSDKFGSHRYTPIYHSYFDQLRDRAITLLEIGIGGYADPAAGGASLRMWRDYFPHARILGLDYFDKAGVADDRIRVFRGSQADPRTMVALIDAAPEGQFDIIVDDGSHRSEHVITTFLMLFPQVKEGGWYVVEDTETSYWPEYGGVRSATGDRFNTMAFFRQLADGLNWSRRDVGEYVPTYHDLNVFTVHFYHNLIFIRKGSPV